MMPSGFGNSKVNSKDLLGGLIFLRMINHTTQTYSPGRLVARCLKSKRNRVSRILGLGMLRSFMLFLLNDFSCI